MGGDLNLPKGATAQFFRKVKPIPLSVGDCEVGEIDIPHGPSGAGLGGHQLQSMPEESDLVPVGVSRGVLKVAGEIPPFGFKLRMGAVVAGELPAPGCEGAGPFYCPGNGAEEEDRK